MVTVFLCREEPDQHDEEDQVAGRGQESPRDQKFIGDEETEAGHGQEVRRSSREKYLPPAREDVSAKQQRTTHQQYGRRIQSAGGGARPTSRDNQRVEY